MVVAQAMAASKPVIASKAGGISSLIKDGEAGFLIEPGNVQELSEKIIKLLKNSNLRKKMGESGRVEAKRRFASEVIAKETHRVYGSILARHRNKKEIK